MGADRKNRAEEDSFRGPPFLKQNFNSVNFPVMGTWEPSVEGAPVKGKDGPGACPCESQTLPDMYVKGCVFCFYGVGYSFHVRRQKRRKDDFRACV